MNLSEVKEEIAKQYNFTSWEQLYDNSSKKLVEHYMGLVACVYAQNSLKNLM